MKSRINCPFTVSFGTNRQMLLTSLPRCVIALGWSVHSCPSVPLRQTVHTPTHYARDFLLLNLAIISSAVSSPFFTFSTAILNAKPSLGSESIKRLRSAIGARVSYCLSSSRETSKAPASLALPRFPLKEIVFQVLCPKGKVRKYRSSLPIHARTNPPYPAIRGFVGRKRFRSCVS